MKTRKGSGRSSQWRFGEQEPDAETMLATLELIQSHRSFRQFLRNSFPVIRKNDNESFSDDWFYAEFGETGEAFINGQLRRIVITTPPGTYKSRTFLVSLIAYAWLKSPWMKFLCGTNSDALGKELSLDTRKLIRSGWYREGFRPEWDISEDQDEKGFFTNTAGGQRQVTSVGSKLTGAKADRILLDDIHDANKVRSITERTNDKRWYYDSVFDRQVDFTKSGILLVEHRLDLSDLPGELIASGWHELRLVERMEDRLRKVFPVTLRNDPRKEGEYLRPKRFGAAQEAEVKAKPGGATAWSAKHQQNPVSVEGSMFPRDKLPPYVSMWTAGLSAVRFWDTAASKLDTASHTSGVLIGRTPGPVQRWQIVHVKRGRWGWAERDDIILRTAQEDRMRSGMTVVDVVIEHPGGSGGLQTWQILAAKLAGFNVHVQTTSGQGSKTQKAGPLSSQWLAGNVDIVDDGSWPVLEFVERMEAFPGMEQLDDTDAAAGGFNWQAAGNTAVGVEPATGADTKPPASVADDFASGYSGTDFQKDFRDERF